MSGPQILDWYETARQETGLAKLMDLQVLVAPNEKEQFERVQQALIDMAESRREEE